MTNDVRLLLTLVLSAEDLPELEGSKKQIKQAKHERNELLKYYQESYCSCFDIKSKRDNGKDWIYWYFGTEKMNDLVENTKPIEQRLTVGQKVDESLLLVLNNM